MNLKSFCQKEISFIFISSKPLMILFILFANVNVLFLLGSAFKGSIIPMQITMLILLFIGITILIGFQIMMPLGKEKLFYIL